MRDVFWIGVPAWETDTEERRRDDDAGRWLEMPFGALRRTEAVGLDLRNEVRAVTRLDNNSPIVAPSVKFHFRNSESIGRRSIEMSNAVMMRAALQCWLVPSTRA